MTTFTYADAPAPVPPGMVQSHRAVWERMAKPGSWWSGEQRVAIAAQARAARAARNDPPWLRKLPDPGDVLPAAAVKAARIIGADAHQIDAEWAKGVIDELGDAAYIELASVIVCLTAVDAFAEAVGTPHEPLPSPLPGEPDRVRPDGLADAGAYVPMTDPWVGPNVARALSLSPEGNQTFMGVVMTMYGAGGNFFELVWDGPLTRPQCELMAARVSALNECFY